MFSVVLIPARSSCIIFSSLLPDLIDRFTRYHCLLKKKETRRILINERVATATFVSVLFQPVTKSLVFDFAAYKTDVQVNPKLFFVSALFLCSNLNLNVMSPKKNSVAARFVYIRSSCSIIVHFIPQPL